MSNPRNANKKIILILIMMFPTINTLITHALTFTQHREHCQCENGELGHLGWKTAVTCQQTHALIILFHNIFFRMSLDHIKFVLIKE